MHPTPNRPYAARKALNAPYGPSYRFLWPSRGATETSR